MNFHKYLVFFAFCLLSFPAFASKFASGAEIFAFPLLIEFVILVLTIILYCPRSPQGCLFAVILEVPAIVIISVLMGTLIFSQSYNEANMIISSWVVFFIFLALIIHFRPAKMAEIQPELVEGKLKSSHRIIKIVYILQAMVLIFPFLVLILPFQLYLLNYSTRTDVNNTWLDSHFRWQIRTFWFYFPASVIIFAGVVADLPYLLHDLSHDSLIVNLLRYLSYLLCLYPLLYLWIIYRTMKGWMKLIEGKSV